MDTSVLASTSTHKAKATALAAFTRFLEKFELTMAAIQSLISDDASGNAFVKVMDRFALDLVYSDGKRGKTLACNTVLGYFGSVKNAVYDLHPSLHALCECRIQGIYTKVDKYITKSQHGTTVRQAPQCTRQDLAALVRSLYKTASVALDYTDASLLVLMWHLFGRSSDMVSLTKRGFTVHPAGCRNVRFDRMKTSTEMGLALYINIKDFTTCPIHAVAVAQAMDKYPAKLLFTNMPRWTSEEAAVPEELSLVDLLQSDECIKPVAGGQKAPGVHAHINRTLRGLRSHPDVYPFNHDLKSHSFRRGGAQEANRHPSISLQWILDRGGWQLSTLNKAFVYIFNSTSEDHQVAKVLSEWAPEEPTWSPELSMLGAAAPLTDEFAKRMLSGSTCSRDAQLTFSDGVVSLLAATMTYKYPDVMAQNPDSPCIHRVRAVPVGVDAGEHELLAWAMVLRYAHRCWRERKSNTDRKHVGPIKKPRLEAADANGDGGSSDKGIQPALNEARGDNEETNSAEQ